MPLHILIALVVGGIAGIAALTWAFGLSGFRRLETEAEARVAWEREFPDIPVQSVTLGKAGAAALVTTPKGPGIVWSMGADTTARFLLGARIDRSRRGLTIRLPDYTAPTIRLTLDDSEAEAWASAIGEHA